MERPILDGMGRPVRMSNGSQPPPDPVQGILMPCYFSLVPAVAQSHPDSLPEHIAELSMEIAIAACAKIGLSITDKSKES